MRPNTFELGFYSGSRLHLMMNAVIRTGELYYRKVCDLPRPMYNQFKHFCIEVDDNGQCVMHQSGNSGGFGKDVTYFNTADSTEMLAKMLAHMVATTVKFLPQFLNIKGEYTRGKRKYECSAWRPNNPTPLFNLDGGDPVDDPAGNITIGDVFVLVNHLRMIAKMNMMAPMDNDLYTKWRGAPRNPFVVQAIATAREEIKRLVKENQDKNNEAYSRYLAESKKNNLALKEAKEKIEAKIESFKTMAASANAC